MTDKKTANKLQRTIVNPVIQDQVTFISTADETGGAYTEVRVTLMPGGGTPPHIHKILTEQFSVLSGTLGLQLGQQDHLLLPGDWMTVPPGTVHRFYNGGCEPVTFHVLITPGSEGFERSLRILYGLAASGLTNNKAIPRSLTHLAVIADISDMHTAGRLRLLAPLMRRRLQKARQSGEYEALIHRYCN